MLMSWRCIMNETIVIDTDCIKNEDIKSTLRDIINDMNDAGYNAYKQITEYLITGEVGYITSYKECRSRIEKINRRDLVEFMLKEYTK
ncbi:MAG TPA: DUF965 domain-containing protein [Firmicutes bacterium]|nr:DUF965 domain-containing protein [Bacillota bacterium]